MTTNFKLYQDCLQRIFSCRSTVPHDAVTRLDHGNHMLREVYANDISPNEAKKDPLRGYRNEAAMTTTTEKRSGKKRDVSEVVCHKIKTNGSLCEQMPYRKTSTWGHHHEVVLRTQDELPFG